jgi:membrane fusion protein, multidrug efflux system
MIKNKSVIWSLLIILIIAGWIGSGYWNDQDNKEIEPPNQINSSPNVDVRYIISVKNSFNDVFKILAKTEPEAIVELRVQTEGIVNDIFFNKGSFVEKDQIICKLNENDKPEIYQAALSKYEKTKVNLSLAENEYLNAAKAKYLDAEIKYISLKKLVENGFASRNSLITEKSNYELAKSDLTVAENNISIEKTNIKIAKAELSSAKINLDHINTIAPFSGIIDDINLEVGELAQKTDICAVLIDQNPIIVAGSVSEKNVSNLKTGMPARAKLINGNYVEGKIRYISNLADINTRSFRFEVEINNPNNNIMIGTTTEIFIDRKIENTHKIPSSILNLSDDGEIGVKIIDQDNIVQFIPVEIINLNNDGAFISNLPDKIKIITVGQDYVMSGETVNGVLDTKNYND